jgi:hypothetical protein
MSRTRSNLLAGQAEELRVQAAALSPDLIRIHHEYGVQDIFRALGLQWYHVQPDLPPAAAKR